MEKCLITGKLLSDDKLVYTLEGPLAAFLWGRREIRRGLDGLVLIPPELVERFRVAIGKEIDPDQLEKKENGMEVFDKGTLLGLTEAKAISHLQDLKRMYRVVERDGELLMATMEVEPNRVNLIIKNGIVSGARLGYGMWRL